jgi:Periplasmic copper-binding protein (NosD)
MSWVTLLTLSVLFALQVSPLRAATTLTVGGCKPHSYSTISAAVAAAPAGATVQVCPGTYPEQVLISQPLTLEGVSNGNAGAAVITSPSTGLAANGSSLLWGTISSQLLVENTDVEISDLVIDGSNSQVSCSEYNAYQAGIYLINSSATVKNVEVRNQEFAAPILCGVGIWEEINSSSNASVTIQDNNVHDFNFYGIFVETTGSETGTLTAAVTSNWVQSSNGLYGIATYGSVAAQINQNQIAGIYSGILMNGLPDGTATDNTLQNISTIGINASARRQTVTGNRISGALEGILVEFGPETISSNTISHTIHAAIDLQCSPATLQDNVINGGGFGVVLPLGAIPASNQSYNVVEPILGGTC